MGVRLSAIGTTEKVNTYKVNGLPSIGGVIDFKVQIRASWSHESILKYLIQTDQPALSRSINTNELVKFGRVPQLKLHNREGEHLQSQRFAFHWRSHRHESADADLRWG